LNPVEVAENVATLDHITHGRLLLGVAIGYREQELETAGLIRKDRGPKLEESIQLMKRLWSGEEVTFRGKYVNVTKGRMGFIPHKIRGIEGLRAILARAAALEATARRETPAGRETA